MADDKRDEVETILALSKQMGSLLAGHPPGIQGAVLAELLSMWVAGHHPAMRKEILDHHNAMLPKLIEINSKNIWGPEVKN